jgi:ParB/RepB/Spo0J family partition protein
MNIQEIRVSDCYPSPTNPRGEVDIKSESFKDLVSSIQEKGIIVPIVVRINKPMKGKRYEVIAGNRRFRAAMELKLEKIPADILNLSDSEAREIQIIENLHREGVHPLDEGFAYRELMEKGKLEVESVAAKCGKPISYIKQRLHLTNLNKKAADFFRNGKMSAGHAVLVSRLDDSEQNEALKRIENVDPDIADLREWIRVRAMKKITANTPWKDHAEAVAALAPCPECSKRKGPTLFGEKEANQCEDPKCFARKLAAHIQIVKDDFKEKKIPLTLVAGGYIFGDNLPKGVLPHDQYRTLNDKEKCDSEHKALIVAGDLDDGLGKIIRICTDEKCKVHGSRRGTVHRLTPKELKERRDSIKREEDKKKREAKEVEDAVKKVKLPIGSKAINVLLEIMVREIRDDGRRELVKLKGWEVLRTNQNRGWGDKKTLSPDYDKTLRENAKKMTDEEKLRLIFQGFIMSNWEKKKILKML